MQEIYSYSYFPYTKWATREYVGGGLTDFAKKLSFNVYEKSLWKRNRIIRHGVEKNLGDKEIEK